MDCVGIRLLRAEAGVALMSHEAEHASEPLRIEAEYLGSEVIVVLEGEFDMTSTTQFWTHIRQAFVTSATSITIDARGVTFIDSTGLGALLRARAEADERGVAFRFSDPSPMLRRVAQVAGIEDLLPDE